MRIPFTNKHLSIQKPNHREKFFADMQQKSTENVIREFIKMGLISNNSDTLVTENFNQLSNEVYKGNSVAYSIIKDIASNGSNVPLNIYKKSSRSKSKSDILVEKAELYTLLENPNQYQKQNLFIESLISYYLISGNCPIWGAVPNIEDPSDISLMPKYLYPLIPSNVELDINKFGVADYVITKDNGSQIIIKADLLTGNANVNLWKTYNPDCIYKGLSPFEAAGKAVKTHNEGSRWNMNLLKNDAKISNVLSYGGDVPLSDTQYERIQENYKEFQSGAENAGKSFFSDFKMDVKPITVNPKDLDFLEGKQLTAKEIARALKYPVPLLGLQGDSTYNNVAEAKLDKWESAIIPVLDDACQELGDWLLPREFKGDSSYYIKPDYDQVSDLAPRRDKLWVRMENATFLTDNEKREALDYEPIVGADTLLSMVAETEIIKTEKQLAYKLFDDDSPAEARREIAIQESLNAKLRRGMANQFNGLLNNISKQASKGYELDRKNGATLAVEQNWDNINILLNDYNRKAALLFGNRVLKALQEKYHKDIEVKDVINIFEFNVEEWITTRGLESADDITATTKKGILDVILSGEKEGLGVDEIARSIVAKTGGAIARNRANLISRTEIHTASNYGNYTAVKTTRLPMLKKWLHTHDKRTRDTHKLSTIAIRMDDFFKVGGSKMMYPGDPSMGASAGEVVNCRCALGYEKQ